MPVASSQAVSMPQQRSFWIPVISGAMILTIGIGARQSFGIFQKPIAVDLRVGRELWSFANALAMLLMGVFSPFVGNLADRFGTARTVAAGGVLYVIGMFMIAFASEGVSLTLGNVLCGNRHGGCGFRADLWRHQPANTARETLDRARCRDRRRIIRPIRHRAVRLAAAVSARQLAYDNVDPRCDVDGDGAARLRTARTTRGGRKVRRGYPARHQRRTARGVPDARLLAADHRLLRCGFHVSFIGLHLPSYISDNVVGMSFFGTRVSALEVGGWAIGLVGLLNLAGSLIWGWLGSQYPKKDMLALLYALRALAFVMFLALPLSLISVLLFSASLGFLWLGTVPLTSGLVGYMFGPTHMSMLWGIVFFSHQLGGFLGGWGAGRLYDIKGNYDLMWWIAVGLGVFAAVIHWCIRERPVPRLAMAAATA